MRFEITEELQKHMREKGKRFLTVECAVTDTSDIEIAEIYLRLANAKFAEYLQQKKRYRAFPVQNAPDLTILLCPYHLTYQEHVAFSLRKTWIFKRLHYEGISL